MLRENSGLCPCCLRSGLIFSRYRRVADELLPQIPSVSAHDLARSSSKVFELAACPGLKLGAGDLSRSSRRGEDNAQLEGR